MLSVCQRVPPETAKLFFVDPTAYAPFRIVRRRPHNQELLLDFPVGLLPDGVQVAVHHLDGPVGLGMIAAVGARE